ncbi:GGDEF domain-containing protein [Achromobacter sp. NPDC058515]|uniref:GGDEF domain-containing protein n=1 Tax=Achromobacter sp. NPDC058515 TaxID=3346533 RepID=UPI003668B4A8
MNYITFASFLLASLFTILYFGIGTIWHSYANNEQTRRTLRVAGAGFKTMDALVRESASTSEALDKNGHDLAGQISARAATDSAIADFNRLLTSSECAPCKPEAGWVAEITADLSVIRELADHYLKNPDSHPPGRQFNSILKGMARLVPQTQAILADQLSAAWKAEAGLGEELALLTFISELCERLEQLRTSFVPALAERRQLSAVEQLRAERTIARIEELHGLIDKAIMRRAGLQNSASIKSKFFSERLHYIRDLQAKLTQSAHADISIIELNRQYRPLALTITDLRDDLLRSFSVKTRQREAVLKFQFVFVGLAVLTLSVTLVWGLVGFWKRILHPFGIANRIIRSFISEDPAIQLPPAKRYRGVAREFFETLSSLKEHIDLKRNLESQRNELIEALQEMAETDHLTGLLNRRAFEKRVAKALDEWSNPEELLAVILFDIDHFKGVNDSFGHVTGDAALATIAQICQGNCRKTDIIARVGGEEFSVVCFVNSAAEAHAIAHRLRLNIQNKEIMSESGSSFHVTASFGVAVSRRNEECNIGVIFGRSDQLLYIAKASGRNRVVLGDGQETI